VIRTLRNSVRELRLQRGLSQAELGDLLAVSRQAVNAIENGKHDPSLSLAFKISRLFERPLEAIFGDE
jgi:putative transcriptional regulator